MSIIELSKEHIPDSTLLLLAEVDILPIENPTKSCKLITPTSQPDIRLLIIHAIRRTYLLWSIVVQASVWPLKMC